MRKGGGRAKGNAFEREVAHMIVAAFKRFGITEKDCYRTPLSGGHRFASQSDPGDLVLSPKLQKLFPFTVECKRDRRWDWVHLFEEPRRRKKSWVVGQFLQQAAEQAEHTGRAPVLVVRRDREPAVILYPPFAETFENSRLSSDHDNILGHTFEQRACQWLFWKAIPLQKFLSVWARERKKDGE